MLPFDSLIVAAGAEQNYFGNDQFATFAPGMKTVDDALEVRAHSGAFEAAEVTTDPAERTRRLTFVVVGGGPTGVELAGQIVELAQRTLPGAFRTIDPRRVPGDAVRRVAPRAVADGENLGMKAQRRLQKMGVEVYPELSGHRCRPTTWASWSEQGDRRRTPRRLRLQGLVSRVAASLLGAMIADQCEGTEVDRSGRVVVEPDLSVRPPGTSSSSAT